MDSGGSGEAGGVATVSIAGATVAAESGFARLAEAADEVLHGPLQPVDASSAVGAIRVLEAIGRKVYAAQVELQSQIQAAGLHRDDGHSTASAQVRHHAKLTNGEARSRGQVAKMLAALPQIREALWAGEIGIDQVRLLGRVYGNQRVRGAMELRQERFIEQAQRFDYRMFEQRVREWERLIDENGPEPPNERTHRNRTATMVQDPIELGWELVARFAAMQGAAVYEIFQRYIDAEWKADWEKAVAEHGDNATLADMPRTDAQRRADALWQIFQDAAASPNSAVPPGFTHNVEWDQATYQEMLRRMDGEDPQPLDPDTYRCQTTDGIPLEPHEAAANSLLHGFRRIVTGAPGVVLDAGKKRRFTGVLRDVVNLQSHGQCVWPGCQVPATRCEADHVTEHGGGGLTNPGNGAPLCGKHNRWKQKGFRLRRDPTGDWHTYRPDGTEIPN